MPRISAKMMTEITYNPLNLEPGDKVWMAMCSISELPERTTIFMDQMIIDTKAMGGKIHVRYEMSRTKYIFDPNHDIYDYTSAITKNKQDAIRWIEREIEKLRKILSPAAMGNGDKKYALFTKSLSSREILSARSKHGEIKCHEFSSY